MKRLLLLGVALVLVLAVGGCGETVIDSAKTEGAIEVKTGTKFQCVVTEAGGKKQTATLKILNEDADVSLVDLSPNK